MQDEYILKATDIIKSFAGVKALRGVNLEIKKGEIHCLAGENGCGKSTLIKIISGVYSLDSGKVEFNGVDQTHQLSPINAIMNGIQVIYQDFSIFPNLSVMENLAYNSELMQKRKFVNWKRFRAIAEEAVSKINFNVDLEAKVGTLPVADKQLVAISRALINNAKLIICLLYTSSYPSTMAVILLMLEKLGRENSGVTIDYGHAHVAGENVAESVALAKEYGNRLLHVHMNDNYGFWDDDMIAGSIHTIPFIEFFYWLKRTGYDGYISTDQYPYREDGRDAVNETVRWMDIFAGLANRIDEKELEEIYATGNACEVSAMLRDLMFGK